MGITSIQTKIQELSRLGYPFIPNRSSLSFDLPSLHPSGPLPSNLRLTDSRPLRGLVVSYTRAHKRTHSHAVISTAWIWSDGVTRRQHYRSCFGALWQAGCWVCVGLWACSGLQGSEAHCRQKRPDVDVSWRVQPSGKRPEQGCTRAVGVNKDLGYIDAQPGTHWGGGGGVQVEKSYALFF